MKNILLLTTLLIMGLLLVGCGTEATPSPTATPDTAALVEHGKEMYLSLYCGVCHTLDAANTTGTFGPVHNGVGTMADERIHASNYTGKATTPAGYLRESLLDPSVYIVDGFGTSAHQMPTYSQVEDADLDALVAFLLDQK